MNPTKYSHINKLDWHNAFGFPGEEFMNKEIITVERIESKILLIRGQKVMLDSDLAALYGVPTKVFNQAVKRNRKRFPPDFLFRLTRKEKEKVVTNCDHLRKLKFSPTLPSAFTEHGAVMAANVLNGKGL